MTTENTEIQATELSHIASSEQALALDTQSNHKIDKLDDSETNIPDQTKKIENAEKAEKEKIPNKKKEKSHKAWKKKKAIKPGRLYGSIPFEIHTADAQACFRGYHFLDHGTKEVVGLLQFGGQMSLIWDAAKNDDPYADWYLLKTYDAMIKLRHQLARALQDYQQQIQQTYGRDNLSLSPFASQKPVVQTLWFRTQYGYLGANVIADFDLLMRTVITANRVGVLLDKTHEQIKEEWGVKIIELFKLPFKWQSFNITRADVKADNESAQTAQKLLGKLPERVLNKTLRSPFAPLISSDHEQTMAIN